MKEIACVFVSFYFFTIESMLFMKVVVIFMCDFVCLFLMVSGLWSRFFVVSGLWSSFKGECV